MKTYFRFGPKASGILWAHRHTIDDLRRTLNAGNDAPVVAIDALIRELQELRNDVSQFETNQEN